MKILLIVTLCLISDGGASKEVTGYSGGGILIKCKYDTEYTQNAKYFCKVSWADCSEQIKTGAKNQWVNSGRFSLFDDTRSSEFWVMIRELTVQDTGTYQCGVYRDLLIAIETPVELKVKKGSLVSRDVTAYAGTRSNIKCKYDEEYKDKPKSFYKIEETDQWSFNQIRTNTKSEWSHKGRFSIHDKRSAGFFSVFIRELNMEDTGTYACVVVTDETEIYTIVKINVTEGLSYEKSISETVHIGQDLTVSCNYPESHRNDNKFFCKRTATAACSYVLTVKESRKNVKKGHLSLYDDREKQILTVSLKNMAEQDAGEYWCGAEVNWKSDHGYKVYFTRINLEVTGFPVVVIVLAILLPLLCIISSLGVILYKRYKRQVGQATTAQTYRESNSGVENEAEAVYDSVNVNVYQFDPVYENLSF
ncbi:polymeric immunoglobulin receptor-like [Tachysurus vachellii]|uniref:polymeric immunoglobulin receptor-like n=1 Tax=Tachysurus vachellii TaxID=175792 RepID=UPI00296AF101|nr:polymeric immunoglobulin receptor-like [Tachysurus vachellii]